jgi:hypothetical protein
MISNILESNVPIMTDRNYAPTRTFVTKWDIEIENNRTKKISRQRERDTKYFEDFDQHGDSLPEVRSEYGDESYYNNEGWEIESDGEGEETQQGWLWSIHAENAYYEQKYGKDLNYFKWYDDSELETNQTAPVKRALVDFEESVFKRVRA